MLSPENSQPPKGPSDLDLVERAHRKAERATFQRLEERQARKWRVMHQRPSCVLIASVTLVVLSGLALGCAPFVAIHEQMYGSLPVLGHTIVRPMVTCGAMFLPLAVLVGQGRNWARWLLILVSVGLLVQGFLNIPSWWLSVPVAALVLYIRLLFNRDANRFFGVR